MVSIKDDQIITPPLLLQHHYHILYHHLSDRCDRRHHNYENISRNNNNHINYLHHRYLSPTISCCLVSSRGHIPEADVSLRWWSIVNPESQQMKT